MSNKQARSDPGRRLVLKRIVLTFEDGSTTMLDTTKVMIVDRKTLKPLFKEVMEEVPHTNQPPEAEIVQNGNWTGVRPKPKE